MEVQAATGAARAPLCVGVLCLHWDHTTNTLPPEKKAAKNEANLMQTYKTKLRDHLII